MSIRPTTSPALADQLKDPAYSAYVLLRTLFTVAPILFGLDKFFNLLTHPQHWNMYLAGWINDLVPGTAPSGPAALLAQVAGRENDNTSANTTEVIGSQRTANRSSPDTGWPGKVP